MADVRRDQKVKYMHALYRRSNRYQRMLTHHQNAGQTSRTKSANQFLAKTWRSTNVERSLQTKITLTSKLNLGNVCYHSAQNLLSPRLYIETANDFYVRTHLSFPAVPRIFSCSRHKLFLGSNQPSVQWLAAAASLVKAAGA